LIGCKRQTKHPPFHKRMCFFLNYFTERKKTREKKIKSVLSADNKPENKRKKYKFESYLGYIYTFVFV